MLRAGAFLPKLDGGPQDSGISFSVILWGIGKSAGWGGPNKHGQADKGKAERQGEPE